MAILLTSLFLKKNNLLFQDNEEIITPSDLLVAAQISENLKNQNQSAVIKEIMKCLQYTHFDDSFERKNMFEKLKYNPSKENAINYIVKYIEDYNNKQGYYDFYKSSSFVYKIHYHGRYYNFKLNVSKTIEHQNTLYFDATAIAYMEVPYNLECRNEIIKKLYDEIKSRSYKDVIINDLIKKLKQKLNPYFDLNQIILKFNFSWSIDIDTNYEF